MRRLTYVTFTPKQVGGGGVMLCLLYYVILCYTITRWICWRNSKCDVLCYTVSHWIYWNVLCYVMLYCNSLKSLHAFSYYKTCGLKLRLIHKQSMQAQCASVTRQRLQAQGFFLRSPAIKPKRLHAQLRLPASDFRLAAKSKQPNTTSITSTTQQ